MKYEASRLFVAPSIVSSRAFHESRPSESRRDRVGPPGALSASNATATVAEAPAAGCPLGSSTALEAPPPATGASMPLAASGLATVGAAPVCWGPWVELVGG